MLQLSDKLNSNWKSNFTVIFNNTPKKLRRNISQINNIKSQAKIYVDLYYGFTIN